MICFDTGEYMQNTVRKIRKPKKQENHNNNCKICYKDDPKNNRWLACDACCKWNHAKCLNITAQVFKGFTESTKEFICKTCI